MTNDQSPEEMAWWDEMRQPIRRHAKRTPRHLPRVDPWPDEIPPTPQPFFTDEPLAYVEDEVLQYLAPAPSWWVVAWRHVQFYGEQVARGLTARPMVVFTITADTRPFDRAAAKLIERLETSSAPKFWRRTP
jgi:hypothetical protein